MYSQYGEGIGSLKTIPELVSTELHAPNAAMMLLPLFLLSVSSQMQRRYGIIAQNAERGWMVKKMEYNCMKCIVDDFKTSLCEDGYCERFYGKTGNFIDLIPRWIPCSERLPNTNGIYIVTRRISDGFEYQNITDACYFDGSNTWHDDTRVNHERKYLVDVLAWMPLPEPYKEVEQDG